jgi:alpha-amylase
MVGFANAAGTAAVANWWDNGNNQIAFGRGNRAFIVLNGEGGTIDRTFNTGLPNGNYCDVISGSKEGGKCTGKSVQVNNGQAKINVPASPDGIFAIHVNAKL